MRVQLALNVPDMESAVAHYSRMFATSPHKRRPGYANFEIASPPLKLVLFENPQAAEALNHLGVEVQDAATFAEIQDRMAHSGLSEPAEDTLCCHARQDKLWVRSPKQEAWEWYMVTDDNPAEEGGIPADGCCAGDSAPETACCAGASDRAEAAST